MRSQGMGLKRTILESSSDYHTKLPLYANCSVIVLVIVIVNMHYHNHTLEILRNPGQFNLCKRVAVSFHSFNDRKRSCWARIANKHKANEILLLLDV